MRIITRKRLRDFSEAHSDAAKSLDAWYQIAKRANWKNSEELKKDFNSTDIAGKFTVFNIKGNQYRLIVDIQYHLQTIYIKYVLTHSDYDKDEWKQDPYY